MHILDYTAAGAEGDPLLRPRAPRCLSYGLPANYSLLSPFLCAVLCAWPSLAASGAGPPLFPFFLVPQLVSIVRIILANFRHEAGRSLHARAGEPLSFGQLAIISLFSGVQIFVVAENCSKVVNEKNRI